MDSKTKLQELHSIADALYKLTAAVQDQNELLQKLIVEPTNSQPRIMVGLAGVVETVEI